MRAGKRLQASGLLEPRLGTATSGSLASSTRPAAAYGASIEAATSPSPVAPAAGRSFCARPPCAADVPVELRMIFERSRSTASAGCRRAGQAPERQGYVPWEIAYARSAR